MLVLKSSPLNPTVYEKLLKSAFESVKERVMVLLDKANTLDAIGRRDLSLTQFNTANDYHYVIWYFTLIKMWQIAEVTKGNTVTLADIEEKYDLECVKTSLACRGVAIKDLLAMFGFVEGQDGINYMDISIGTNVWQIQ